MTNVNCVSAIMSGARRDLCAPLCVQPHMLPCCIGRFFCRVGRVRRTGQCTGPFTTSAVSTCAIADRGGGGAGAVDDCPWQPRGVRCEHVCVCLPCMSACLPTPDCAHQSNCGCITPPASAVTAGITWLNGSDSGGECNVPLQHRYPLGENPWYVGTGVISC